MSDPAARTNIVLRRERFDIAGHPDGGASIVAAMADLVVPAAGADAARAVDMDIDLDAAATITQIGLRDGGDPVLADRVAALIGRPAGRGLRAWLTDQDWPDATARMARRLLWDLPVLVSLRHQTRLLDHPGAPGAAILPLAGTDQCSGWRANGEMLQLAAAHDGYLAMPLTAPTTPADRADPWAAPPPPLTPMGTRRARALTVWRDGAEVALRLTHRDSYADPDGLERRLHEWTTGGRYDPATDAVSMDPAQAGRLPWRDCPGAGASAGWLRDARPADIGPDVSRRFRGVSTCTHLNDTLALLGEVGDVADLMPRAEDGARTGDAPARDGGRHR